MLKSDSLIKKPLNRGLTIILIINAFFVFLTIARAFFCIAILDEAFNVGQANRTIQGNQFLVENWDYFQTGDSFLTPFLYIFIKVTGSSEGIILFSRIVFIVLQTLLSVFIFRILSRYFDRIAAFFSVLIYETAVLFLLFYMWYDNWEVYFRLIGLFLIVLVNCSYDKLSPKKSYLLIFLAGVVHACMVYAYPTMIIVYILVLSLLYFYKRKQNTKIHKYRVLFYILGSAFVFIIFLSYVLRIGINKLFVFNDVISKAGLSSTGRAGFFSAESIITKTESLFVENIHYYALGLIVLVVDLLMLYLLRKNKNRNLWFCIIMVFGFLVQLVNSIVTSDCINMLMTYVSFYTIPLYYLLKKENEKREIYKDLIVLVMIPSYVAGVAYNYTALFGALKFACGARPGAMITILLFYEVLKQSEIRKDIKLVFGSLATFIVAMNVFTMYYVSFEGTKPYLCNTQIRNGIFKGLFDMPENARRYEKVEKDLAEVISDSDKTITCGPYAMEFYLMTDLKPNAANLWDPNNTELLFQYYDMYYGEPDIIVLHDSADDVTSPEFLEFVDENYELARYTDGYFIFHRK